MRRPLPPARTILRPRDPVGELLLVMAVAAFLVAALIGLTAVALAFVPPA